MVDRAITRFIDVQIRKDSPLVSAAGFGILLVLTNYKYLTTSTRVKEFTSESTVEDFFGEDSEEWKAADAYFNQDPFLSNAPENLFFGRYADDDTEAILEGGDEAQTTLATWQAVTDGEFAITIDATLDEVAGLDFSSVASLADVATVITTGLTQGTCTYRDNRFVFESPTDGATSTITLCSTVSTPAGTDISGTGFLDCDVAKSATNPGGSVLSQGQAAETVEDAITAIENVNNDWYALGIIVDFRDDSAVEDMADAIESRRKIFISATNDSNVLITGNTSTTSYYVNNANYKRTGFIYHDNDEVYPDMSWLGQQLPKDIGSTNWAYKTLAGIAEGANADIDPVDLTEDEKDAALGIFCNLYTATLSADYTYFGTMGGGRNADKDGEYIDIVRNVDFLQARIEEGLLSLLLERDIIPYTDAGITIVDNRLKARLQEFGVDQGILVNGTVETSFPKRSETSSEDRGDRLLPDGRFQAELVGGINKIVVRGTVYV